MLWILWKHREESAQTQGIAIVTEVFLWRNGTLSHKGREGIHQVGVGRQKDVASRANSMYVDKEDQRGIYLVIPGKAREGFLKTLTFEH